MKRKSKLAALVLTSVLSTSCAFNTYGEDIVKVEESIDTEHTLETNNEEKEIIDLGYIEQKEIDPLDDVYNIMYITTTSAANFRVSPSLDSNIIYVVPNNSRFYAYTKVNDFYEIIINGEKGYIHESIIEEIGKPYFPYSFEKIVYLTEDKVITLSDGKEAILPKNESCEVYKVMDDGRLLVKTNEYAGYITTENTEELTGKFVIVDISDQELKMYEDNKVILYTPVVTGKKSTPSTEGIFAVYDITTNRYLVGPGYRSYVDVMMKYYYGEGLHDAEYHTDDDGFSHGWRNITEFGGNTYINNGSHGCINMPHDAAMEAYSQVEIGTKVLVKK